MTGEWVGPAAIAALISSVVTAAGWVISYRNTRKLDSTRRDERVFDVQTAIRADIRSNRARLRSLDLEQHAQNIANKIRSAAANGEGYTPFVPHEPHSLIFSALVSEIQILPASVIDPVVLYYRQMETIARFVDDLRSERFAQLDKDRKIEMFDDYIGLNTYALELANQAIDAINAALEKRETL